MGNSHSEMSPDADQAAPSLTQKLAGNFLNEELLSFKTSFDALATPVGKINIWTQDTFTKYLQLPSNVESMFFASATFIASYPEMHESPRPLTLDALLRVIAIMTERTKGALMQTERLKLIFNSFAVIVSSDSGKEKDVGTKANKHIRKEDLRKLLIFLLSIQEKSDTEVVANYIHRFDVSQRSAMNEVTTSICDTIADSDEVSFDQLSRFLRDSPFLLSSLSSLYAHFFHPMLVVAPSTDTVAASTIQKPLRPSQTLPEGTILTPSTLAQLATFIPRDLIFGTLDLLYRADRDGFSMGSFETKTLRYPGPTLMLLSGYTHSSTSKEVRKVGVFCNVPWKQSSKSCFGDNSILFELSPRHFLCSSFTSSNELWFHKTLGVGIGSSPPVAGHKVVTTGPASLYIDTNLEIAKFAFSARDIKEDIEISDIEIFGLGGSESLKKQREAWQWQEAEAQRRQGVNVKDHQGDWDLLELAGLVGQNRSGGSI